MLRISFAAAPAPLLQIQPAAISTLAGSSLGYADGAALSASFRFPQGLAIDAIGNIYVADTMNQMIRKIAPGNNTVSTIVGTGAASYTGDGGLALAATLNTPTGVAVDAAGNLYIADQGNNAIRRVDALSGIITTVAGGNSTLYGPNNVVLDTSGNLYIADSFNNVVRKLSSTGTMTIYAGGGVNLGDGGAATAAQLSNPQGIAVDSSGNLYIADLGNSRVRKVTAATQVITTVAGTGSYGNAGDGGPATSAALNSPAGIRLDAAANLYIADAGANVIRLVNASSGIISTIAGNGNSGYTGDLGVATFATLNNPMDVLTDASGNVLIADNSNSVVRKVTFLPPTLSFPPTYVTLTSAVVPVTLSNAGNAALTFSGLSVSAGFQQKTTGSSDCSVSVPLNPGATCQMSLVFVPTVTGAVSGTLTIVSNSGNVSSSQAIVNLTGNAPSGIPAVTLSPTSLTFSPQGVGTSATKSVTLTNSGTATLPISTIQIAGTNASDFSSATNCGSTLAVNVSCTISVTFNPSLAGTRSAALFITDSSANSPQTVTLTATGTGGASSSFSTTAMQFGTQLIFGGGVTQTLTLSNTGVAALGIYSIGITGANGPDFAVANSTCGSSLVASASCTLTLSFVPPAVGARTASLLFYLSTGLSNPIALSGTGTTAAPGPCVASLSTSTQVYSGAGASDTAAISAPSTCAWSATASASWITITGSTSGSGSGSLQLTIAPNTGSQARTANLVVGTQVETITQMQVALRFIPMTPCRVVDTRNSTGPFGGPKIAPETSRDFPLPSGSCGIPATAQAYAINLTIVPDGVVGLLSAWPTGQTQTGTSVLNSDGRVKANAAIIPAGTNGGITVYSSHSTHVIVDVSGYFVPSTDSSALSFYPLTPCRVVDTRNAPGPLGQPYIPAFSSRNFPVLSSNCGIPASAKAYSLNFTVVPRKASVGVLSAWPAGQPQQLVSTLNDFVGTVVANAAIVQAGTNGDVSVYSSDDTEVIIDVNGYFAPQQAGGTSLYTMTPCRVLDTRWGGGAPLDGILTTSMLNLGQCSIPAQAQSFVLNATVVPEPVVGVLTLWPSGSPKAIVSTLNAFDGAVTSNLSIVPGTNGSINAYTSSAAHVILDMFEYFAP